MPFGVPKHKNVAAELLARPCGHWFFWLIFQLLKQDHEGGEVDEGQEVLGFFLVAGGDSAVVLQLGPEAFDQVAIFVSRPIRFSRRFRVGSTGDHRFGTLSFDGHHDGLRIIPFVCDDHFQWQTLEQRWGLRHVGRLTAGQDQSDWQPQPIHGGVNFGAESASTAAQCLVGLTTAAVRFF